MIVPCQQIARYPKFCCTTVQQDGFSRTASAGRGLQQDGESAIHRPLEVNEFLIQQIGE
jgi:hypothetical protein